MNSDLSAIDKNRFGQKDGFGRRHVHDDVEIELSPLAILFSRGPRKGRQDGQLSIFIALIFQILFVFFAMVVNVGLVVHDKVNLQNAVDLGAYYGASKVAESLNEIAAINYQMRQSYKLFVWRYWVLGSFGNPEHPLYVNGYTNGNYTPQARAQYEREEPIDFTNGGNPQANFPQICTAHAGWLDYYKSGKNGSLCRVQPGSSIPKIPNLPVIPLSFAGNFIVSALTNSIRNASDAEASSKGPFNWYFMANLLFGYRLAGKVHKQMINQIVNEISIDGDKMLDRNGDKIFDGVKKTVRKNLTEANLATFNDAEFQVLNGLATGSLCQQITPINGKGWLPEVQVAPLVAYRYFVPTGNAINIGVFYNQRSANGPNDPQDTDPTIQAYDQQTGGILRSYGSDELQPTDLYHSSLGFEKNPWCMSYVGVRAKTRPRKTFAPFGRPVEMTARAYAAPFGGTIGPWTNASWNRGDEFSDPTAPETDPLQAVRVVGNKVLGSQDPLRRIANYSRFPGDKLGMRSKSALSLMADSFGNYWEGRGTTPQSAGPRAAPTSGRLELLQLAHVFEMRTFRDELSNQYPKYAPTSPDSLRQLELAAVAPDLFDATYYSIEPDYWRNYFRRRKQERSDLGQIGEQAMQGSQDPIISDLGTSVKDGFQFNIKGQVAAAARVLQPVASDNRNFYYIKKWQHLLTGWLHASVPKNTYDPNDPDESPDTLARFASCRKELDIPPSDDKTFGIPGGNCANGGRTGYSVRIISHDYLTRSDLMLGGATAGAGGILNPPPPVDQF